jgi:hypothetical protein
LTRDLNLGRAAQAFADELTDLLNRTMCDGPRLRSVVVQATRRAHVGFGIDAKNLEPRKGIPITIGKAVRCYLGLSYQLLPDDAGTFLMVHSSMVGLFRDQQLDRCLFHYDYERNKPDGYPEAHLQVNAHSEEWRGLLSTTPGAKREVEHLHLPVGGRRFRPSIEDIIEFLIVEGIASGRNGWQAVLNASRDGFLERQLRAAVRRRPESAVLQLEEMGYSVCRPSS